MIFFYQTLTGLSGCILYLMTNPSYSFTFGDEWTFLSQQRWRGDSLQCKIMLNSRKIPVTHLNSWSLADGEPCTHRVRSSNHTDGRQIKVATGLNAWPLHWRGLVALLWCGRHFVGMVWIHMSPQKEGSRQINTKLFWGMGFIQWWNISILMGVVFSRMTVPSSTGNKKSLDGLIRINIMLITCYGLYTSIQLNGVHPSSRAHRLHNHCQGPMKLKLVWQWLNKVSFLWLHLTEWATSLLINLFKKLHCVQKRFFQV